MLSKNLMVLIIILVSLLAVSAVSAADNSTDDVVSIDGTIEDNILNDNVVIDDDLENENITNCQDILECIESQDEISQDDEDILSEQSPPSSYYGPNGNNNVHVSDSVVEWGTTGYIHVSFESCIYEGYYAYDFYVNVEDSNGNQKISKRYQGTTYTISLTHSFSSTPLTSGIYTIKIVNFRDNVVMATAKLTVKNYPGDSNSSDPSIPSDPTVHTYPSFSVRVYDTSMIYGKSGSIDMSISPATNSVLVKYYYYLMVYDSNNVEKISKLYYGDKSSYSYSESYTIGPYKLSPGNYTIKIINYYTSKVMDTAKLTVKSYPANTDYSVNINDTELEYVEGGSISMSIFPASSSTYKYYYYLKIYDSNDKEKVSQVYYNASSDYSKTYNVSKYGLNPGNYTIKIINYIDNQVMDTAKLTVKYTYPTGYYYNVKISDININYGSIGNILMDITPDSLSYYKYYYYLNVYDENNNVMISQLYNSTSSDNSKTYTINQHQLNPGTYTAKILDYYNNIKSSVKLTVISHPTSSDYSINVNNTELTYGFKGSISMSITPSSFDYYKYYYYFKVYDSNDSEVISQLYSGTTYSYLKTYNVDSTQLTVGNYTIKIINYIDNKVMNTSNLTVKATYPSTLNYSVKVSDAKIVYNHVGYIYMSISPASKFTYKYYYYLKVYDSNNSEVISQLYSSTSSASSRTYTFNKYQLNPGNYTIKIINYIDNQVMDTAKLTVISYPANTDYSINIQDTKIEYEYGGLIPMIISPSSNTTYRYYYFLNVFDSNNNLMISQVYKNESLAYYESYNLTQLTPGNYTIKIINYDDYKLMNTAKLTVGSYLSYLNYSVNVNDIAISYGSTGSIRMSISPSSINYYKYYYYLKVYDSNNSEVISELYSSTSSDSSRTYGFNKYQLNPGNYTIKIINYDDNQVMDTAKLTVVYNSPFDSNYSVSISNEVIDYGRGSNITMSISPSFYSYYKYYYYLNIYDLNNRLKISQAYNNTSLAYSESYNILTQLTPGNYTIKIINYRDNKVMNTAKLIVKYPDYPYYSDYSVGLQAFHGNYGSRGLIIMPITPTFQCTYTHYYYLKVYDKDNNEKLSQLYYSTEIHWGQSYEVNPYQLSPGTYTVKIINYYDNKVMNTTEFTVNKVSTNVFAPYVTKVYKNNKYLVITLEDGEGYPISGKMLSINFNGIHSLTTDANGQVKLSIADLSPNTYKAEITFNGDSYYKKSTKTVKVTVKKATPKLTAKAKTFKKSVKTKKYTITLKDNQNKAIKNIKVTIKINKKTYKATTNAKGKATFKIKKLTKKGTFRSIVTFKGNTYYNKVTKKVKMKIK